jgi:hypothetical protein
LDLRFREMGVWLRDIVHASKRSIFSDDTWPSEFRLCAISESVIGATFQTRLSV